MLDSTIPAVLTAPIDGSVYHPLHVAVSADVLAKCAEYSDFSTIEGNSFHGVVFSDSSSYKNIFVVVHLYTIEFNHPSSSTFHLYVTTKFLKHYDLSYGSVVFFKPIHCRALSKVVFCARSDKSYKWAKSKNWQSNLLLSNCENKILCRQNDVLLASPEVFGLRTTDVLFDLIAAVCEPVSQGILTLSTTVLIVNVSDTLTYSQLKHELEHFSCGNNHMLSYSQFSNDTVTPYVRSSDDKIVLKLKVMQRHSYVIQEMFTKMNVVSDPLNVVIVSKDVFQMLNINLGELVMVTASAHTNNALEKKSRLVVFYPSEYELGCNAYVSPYLWFNLTSQPTSLKKSEDMHLEILHDRNISSLPPYASEVYVTLVQSPLYDGTIGCDRMLKNHFAQTRYVVKGDVFGIFFQDFEQNSYELDYLRLPMVFFKISSIEGQASPLGHLIDVDHCKLYQIGTIQSYIPVLMEDSSFHFSELTYFDSPYPSGIDVYVDQLSSLVLPILKMWNRGNFQEFRVCTNILLTGENGCGKTVIVKALCKCLSLHLYHVNCHELAGVSSASTEARLKAVVQKATFFAPCVMLLRNIDFIGKEKELKGENSRVLSSLNEQLKNMNPWGSEWPVIVIATTNNIKLLSGDLASSFLHHVHVDPPLERERKDMLCHLLRPYTLHPNISIDYMSQRTAGFLLGDLSALVSEAIKFRYARFKKIYGLGKMHFLEEDVLLSGVHLTHQDLLSALEKAQLTKAERSGAPKIPSVSWDDVGGLAGAKKEILDTIQLPLNHPELLSTGLRRSGVLLYGPPGTGKTLLAKAVATECSLNFLSVKGPELINMYVGQSEENIRAIFNQARGALPCVIFFDELDSLAPNRGRSGDSGGVTDRVVSQLLTELDGFKNSTEVFVIGATNRPDLIDPALLRPGRFDRHVYVGIPEDQESRLSILKAITRKLPLSENVDLVKIIEACPKNLSGADFYALCSDTMMHRIEKNVELIENGGMKVQDLKTTVETEDFLAALETLVPSVSESELREYQLPDQEF